jgi:2-succinyl-6-hydroxy-2,4-cyclohexadiene-1-carboxylate synthase
MQRQARVRVGEIEIEYEEAGQGGRPFVLVHGFTGSRDDFRDVLGELARHGRTIAPDQRGHGGSTNTGRPEGYTLERLVADLAGLLDALAIERCDLLGHSLGGMVAMRFALAHPARVASLVLMDTAPAPLDAVPKPVRDAGAKLAREQGMETLYQVLRAHAASDPALPPSMKRAMQAAGADAFFERIRRKLLAMDPEAFASLLVVLAEHEGVEHRLGEIRCPAMVIVGAEDTAFLAPSAQMAASIPGAHHVVIPDAAHSPQLENREEWLEAVHAHLERARREPAAHGPER